MSPLVQVLSPVLKPAPSYAHVVASAATRNLRTPAMEKDLLLSMPCRCFRWINGKTYIFSHSFLFFVCANSVLPSPPSAFKATVEKLNKADMHKVKRWERGRSPRAPNNSKDERTDMRTIMKDIELLGHSHMTWKEKKALENKKVVSLGGKLPKQQRLPLSVAKGRMKKQKEREQKMLQERMILGCFGGKYGGGSKRSEVRRRPEDQVLKSSEGHFRNGVLDVKHLLHQTPSRESTVALVPMFNEGKKKGKVKGKKKKGKKGGGRKRH